MRIILRRLAAFSVVLSLCICVSALSVLADGSSEPAGAQAEAPAGSVQPEGGAPAGGAETPPEGGTPSGSSETTTTILIGEEPGQAPRAAASVRVNPDYATEQTADNAGTNAVIHPGSDLFNGAEKIVVTITDSGVTGYQGSSYEFGKEKQNGNSLQNKNGEGSPRFPAFVVDSEEGAEVEIEVTEWQLIPGGAQCSLPGFFYSNRGCIP